MTVANDAQANTPTTETVRRDVVVIGASAGGLPPLLTIVRALPENFDAAVVIAMHLPSNRRTLLPAILGRATSLPVTEASAGARLLGGHVFVAPPSRHLLIREDAFVLGAGASENGYRPAIDVLFRSAAQELGARTVGVILSGTLDDGAAGLAAIRREGGVAIVQSPSDAKHTGMPRAALTATDVDYSVPAKDIGRILRRVTRQRIRVHRAPDPESPQALENKVALFDVGAADRLADVRPASGFVCPSCGGALFEAIEDSNVQRFRCRVGHAFSGSTLLSRASLRVEDAVWSAYRVLKEQAALARQLAEGAARRGHSRAFQRFDARARHAEERANVLREALAGTPEPADDAEQPNE